MSVLRVSTYSEPSRGTEGSYAGLLKDEASGNLLAVNIDQTLLFVNAHTLQVISLLLGGISRS
jgi:hypothetical protein